MNLKFAPTYTQDGSIGLYNFEVDDIYHSSYGAYTESVEKFILPSGLIDFILKNKSVKILDICYGMGYNTKAAIKKCLEINPDVSLNFDCLEFDSDVFAFSFLANQDEFDFDIMNFLSSELFEDEKIIESIYKILNDGRFTTFVAPEKASFFIDNKKSIYNLLDGGQNISNLHNIYYRYISGRNIKKNMEGLKLPKISLTAHLQDARIAAQALEGNYDFMFLDAFTPVKLPTLWSVEFFKKIITLLNEDGCIITYSNSAAVRNGMKEAGLFVGKTMHGTIAFKNKSLLKNPLNEKSLGLLQTRAGIPFYDKDLNSTKDEILSLRQKMVTESDKENSSSFLKKFAKNQN